MLKIKSMLANMESVLNGLTRNLDWDLLDRGFGEFEGRSLSFFPRTQSLGAVLPNNSPGVHSLWIPAIPLRIPLTLKPGSAEPWTPYRIIQSLIKAGAPREAFSFYPTDHAGAGEILRSCGRSLLFGDSSTTGMWENDPRVEIHGPGYSKIIIGEDCVDNWEQYLDVMIASIADNGGRSCVNASAVWAPAHVEEISEALAKRLAQIVPRAADDENAQLAPFVDPRIAERINSMIDQGLTEPGARDVTAAYRDDARLVNWNNCSYLLPTVVLCEPDHPLAMKEFLFPFASVVKVNQDEISAQLGPTLVVTAITKDPSSQHWRHADEPGELGSTSRRQSVRTSLRAPGIPARRCRLRNPVENPLSHRRRGADVLRQLPARQCDGHRVDGARSRRHPPACLHANVHRRAKRQSRSRCFRRHQRVPRTVRSAVSQDAALARSFVGFENDFEPGVAAIDLDEPKNVGRDDGFSIKG
jgi:hypothetical protein